MQPSRPPEAHLAPYLRPGERLLWAGRPDPDVILTGADLFLVPFSLLWGGFAIFWEVAAMPSGPLFFRLWGIPFVAAGVYFIGGRFVHKAYRKRRTAYGLTATRAIVAVGPTFMEDAPIHHVPTTTKRTRDGKHVSVTFGARSGWPWPAYGNTGMDFFSWGREPLTFYDVADPEALLVALDTARRAA